MPEPIYIYRGGVFSLYVSREFGSLPFVSVGFVFRLVRVCSLV